MNPLDIVRRTPKTNCSQCGYPTCLAFSAAVAKSGEDFSKCPYIDSTGLKVEAQKGHSLDIIVVRIGFMDVRHGGMIRSDLFQAAFFPEVAAGVPDVAGVESVFVKKAGNHGAAHTLHCCIGGGFGHYRMIGMIEGCQHALVDFVIVASYFPNLFFGEKFEQ